MEILWKIKKNVFLTKFYEHLFWGPPQNKQEKIKSLASFSIHIYVSFYYYDALHLGALFKEGFGIDFEVITPKNMQFIYVFSFGNSAENKSYSFTYETTIQFML